MEFIVATVEIPEVITESQTETTFYPITVRTFDAEPKVIKKRYSDFLALHESIKEKFPSIRNFPFPKKSYHNYLKGSSIAERQIAFDEYIHLLLEISPLPTEVTLFLGLPSDIANNIVRSKSGNRFPSSAESAVLGKRLPKHKDDAAAQEAEKKLVTQQADFIRVMISLSIFGSVYSVGLLLSYAVWYFSFSDRSFWNSFSNLVSSIFSVLLGAYHRFRLGLEATIILLLITSFFHRILGYAVQSFIAKKCANLAGAFNIKIGWICVRLGLDVNELKISNLYWLNPHGFEQTPYFFRIKSVTLSFQLLSVLKALLNPEHPIIIDALDVQDVKVYIEKGKRREDGLNLWAALGAANHVDEREVRSSVVGNIHKSFRVTTGAVATVASLPVQTLKNVANFTAKYNPVSVVVRGVTSIATSSKSEETHQLLEKAPPTNAGNGTGLMGLLSWMSPSKPEAEGEQPHPNTSMSATTEANSSGVPDDPTWSWSSSDRGIYARDDDADSYYGSDQGEADEVGEQSNHESLGRSATSPQSSSTVGADKEGVDEQSRSNQKDGGGDGGIKKPKQHWGVPFIFDVDHIGISDVNVFAQDLLNAQHIDTSWQRAIEVKVIAVSHRELTQRGLDPQGPRKGLFLDDLVWRVVGRLVNEVVQSNKLTMVTTLTTAAVSQTSSIVSGVAQTAATTVTETVHNFNPKGLFLNAKHLVHNIVGHQNYAVSPEVQLMGLTKVCVKIYRARGILFKGEKVTSPVLCTLALRGQDGNRETLYTTHRQPEADGDDNVAFFDESFILEPLTSLDAVLRVRLYKSTLLMKDIGIGEVLIPIRSGLSGGGSKGSSVVKDRNPSSRSVVAAALTGENVAKIGIKEEVLAWHRLAPRNPNNAGELLLGIELEE